MVEKVNIFENFLGNLSALKWVVIAIILLVLAKRFSGMKRYRHKKKLNGKIVIITGGNTGIGYATAVDFAKRNAKVILACRNKTKGLEAAHKIRTTSRNTNIVFRHLDLSSLNSVREFSRTILTGESRLDVLVNNAGIMACPGQLSEDGFEMQFAVNYLGHFLLTHLLVNLIKKSKGKIINITSYMYKLGRINFTDLNSLRNYNPWTAYYQSKLAIILFTRELSKRLADSNVTVNTVHPGTVTTNLYQHTIFQMPGIWYLLSPVTWLMWKSPNDAASSIVHLVISDDVNHITGDYFSNFKRQQLEDNALDEGTAKKLWEISVDLVGLKNTQV